MSLKAMPGAEIFSQLADLVGMSGADLDGFQARVMFVPNNKAMLSFAEDVFPEGARAQGQSATEALLNAAISNGDAARQVCACLQKCGRIHSHAILHSLAGSTL